MKKLLIKINGKEYIAEVEVLEDDETYAMTEGIRAVSGIDSPPRFPVNNHEPTIFPKQKFDIGRNIPSLNLRELHSPVNGTVVEIPAKVGSTLSEKDVAIVIEAMKMKTNIFPHASGIVSEVHVSVGKVVEQGELLVTFG
jgi:biotin carboxyl carrier protein